MFNNPGVYDVVNWATAGLLDVLVSFWDGHGVRTHAMLEDPTLLSVVNVFTLGLVDTIKTALDPKARISEQLMASLGVVTVLFSAYTAAGGPSVANPSGLGEALPRDLPTYGYTNNAGAWADDVAAWGEGPGDILSLKQQMLDSPSANLWGTLDDGTNQGVKHFADYWELYPERIPSLAERLGVDPSDFSNDLSGFENFTKQAESVRESGILREVNGKQIYYVEGAAKVKKGVVVIYRDGKIQSMMPSDLNSFNKLN